MRIFYYPLHFNGYLHQVAAYPSFLILLPITNLHDPPFGIC